MSQKKHYPPRFVAIAGNIGAGKTSLARMLGKSFNWEVHMESVDDNPYLIDFYHDMKRWAFHLQIYFLNKRFKQIVAIQNSLTTRANTVVMDRTIYEDAYIFAPTLYEMGFMDEREYRTYRDVFATLERFISPPDLLVYLRASVSTLVKHIHQRGRDFELNIRIDYLSRLNEKYEYWIHHYDRGPLLIIDMEKTDFVASPQHETEVLQAIQRHLYGLF